MFSSRIIATLLLLIGLTPFLLLVILSIGSGWSYPRLLPDRLDFAPWYRLLSNPNGLASAILNTAAMSTIVGTASTSVGLLTAKSLRSGKQSNLWLFVAYLPFVLSPIVVAIVLYSLEIRLGIASSRIGVMAAQFIYTFSFATIFFYELWNHRLVQIERLVRSLGGTTWHVWLHAVVPQLAGLIAVCWIQCCLFVWLDYGLVSTLGGGNVPTMTILLFTYIREASVNQASHAGLILLSVSVTAVLFSGWLLSRMKNWSPLK